MVRRITPGVLDGFVSEVRGYLPRIRASLASYARRPDRLEELEEAYRLTHSIKGTASMIDLGALSRLAGRAEEVLEDILTSRRGFDAKVLDSLRATIDNIETKLSRESLAGGVSAAEAPDESSSDRGRSDARTAPTAFEVEAATEGSMDSELAATVAEEFQGYLEIIGTLLRAIETEPMRVEFLSEIRRPLHTMKGTAGIVGMVEVSRLAHRMEDLLTDLDRRGQSVSGVEIQLLFQASDLLVDLVGGGQETEASAARLQAIHGKYEAMLKPDSTLEAAAAPATGTARFMPPLPDSPPLIDSLPKPESMLRVRADRLDGVLRLLGDVTLQRAGFDRQVARMNELQTELQLNLRRLGRMARQLTTELDAGGLAPGASVVSVSGGDLAASEFDSLEMDRYTQLNLLARQLEEAATDSAVVGSGFESVVREVEGFQTRLGVLTRDVQERLAQLRTVRFSTLSSRLHRTVRVTAEKRDKLVSLEIEGDEVELDKDLLEEIIEPLLHLLRNAVDHGIEPPRARVAVGKSDRGRITIRVAYQGTEATIRVRDDGAGLDVDRLQERAVALGLLDPAEVGAALPEMLQSLIFRRGFSTASEVSEVSGRGIGLDVVSTSIARLRGMLEVESKPGGGTEFTIRLPGGQSVLRVLLIASGGESLAVPLATIDRIETVTADDLHEVEGDRKLAMQGESLRALELGEVLSMPPRRQDGAPRFPAIILQVGDQRFALLAERIQGVEEVVARPIAETLSNRLHGIGGAALTGDGRVVLVLNPNDLLREAPTAAPRSAAVRQQRRPEALIVDDSLSVRQVLGRLMDRNGYRPLLARDGKDALEVLKRAVRVPDIAIIDLEMPRMDGYELTRALQARGAYLGMPIVILTTRAGEKHRRKAFELGASEYLVKPFQEKTLLATIRSATQAATEPLA